MDNIDVDEALEFCFNLWAKEDRPKAKAMADLILIMHHVVKAAKNLRILDHDEEECIVSAEAMQKLRVALKRLEGGK